MVDANSSSLKKEIDDLMNILSINNDNGNSKEEEEERINVINKLINIINNDNNHSNFSNDDDEEEEEEEKGKEERRKLMVECGCFSNCMEILRDERNKRSENEKVKICDLIWHIANTDRKLSEDLPSQVVVMLVDLLKRLCDNESLVRVLGGLWVVARSDKNCQCLVENDVTTPLVAFLNNENIGWDHPVKVNSTVVILNISVFNKTYADQLSATEKGGFPPLIQMMSLSNDLGKNKAAVAINNLIWSNVKYKDQIRDLGGIKPLIELIQIHQEGGKVKNEKTIIEACNALKTLTSGNDKNRDAIGEKGILALINLLKNGNGKLKKEAASSFYTVCWNHTENKHLVHRLGGVPLLIKLLKEGNEEEKKDAIGAVKVLCHKSIAIQKEFQQNGGTLVLIQLLQNHEAGIEILKGKGKLYAITTLGYLGSSNNENCQDFIRENGGITLLIDVLKNGSDEEKQESATTLGNLCDGYNRKNQIHIFEKDGISILVDLMKNGKSNNLRSYAASGLMSIVINITRNQDELRLKDGIIQLINMLKIDNDDQMKYDAIGTLWAASYQHKVNAAIIGAEKVVKPLIDLMKYGSNKFDGVNYMLAMLLQNIMESPTVLETIVLENGIPYLSKLSDRSSDPSGARALLSKIDDVFVKKLFNDEEMMVMEKNRRLNLLYHISCSFKREFPRSSYQKWNYSFNVESNEYINFNDFTIDSSDYHHDHANDDDNDNQIIEKILHLIKDNDAFGLKQLLSNKDENEIGGQRSSIDNHGMISIIRYKKVNNDSDTEKISLPCTPLYVAVRLGRNACVKLLLKYYPLCNVNWIPPGYYIRMIVDSCLQGNIELIALLLSCFCEPTNFQNESDIMRNALEFQGIPLPGAIANPSTHSISTRNLSNLQVNSLFDLNFSHPSWAQVTTLDLSNNNILS